MNVIKKFVVRKILERWVANEPNNSIQGVMNKATILQWEKGQCQLDLKLEEQHTNAGGTLHPSMAVLLADVTCALALFSHPKVFKEITYPFKSLTVPSTVNLNFSFLDTSALPGNKVVVKANVRSIEVSLRRSGCDNLRASDGPLASLDVLISHAESDVVLVKGDMLMHIEALAEDRVDNRLNKGESDTA